jgi:hypothetical protein
MNMQVMAMAAAPDRCSAVERGRHVSLRRILPERSPEWLNINQI